jgi:hypothetical protein
MSLEFNLDDMTIAELEEIEELIGGDVLEMMTAGTPKMRLLRVLAWVTMRRSNPDLTMDDVGAMKLSSLNLEAPPTPQ